MVSNTAYLLTGNHLEYLIKLLNSTIICYAYRTFYATMLGSSGVRWLAQHIVHLPLPKYKDDTLQQQLIDADENTANQLISNIYHLTVEEITFIESQ